MRNDLAGTSLSDHDDNVSSGGGPVSGCNGSELVTDLDFDTNADNNMDAADRYYDYEGDGSNSGWLSIGKTPDNPFIPIFEGNDHQIGNVYRGRDGNGSLD
ncbi:MAG: hypothetical protein ACI9LO_002866 [Planctomycetota bacterium]|jgi:hypothetical protein